MKTDNFHFSGKERIKSKKVISRIFNDGIFHFSELVIVRFYIEKEPEFPFHQAVFVVPKKKFKKAVDRNRIKRLMKEAYRLNKNILYEYPAENGFLKAAFLYNSSEMPDFFSVQENIVTLLLKLKEELK